MQHAYHFLDEQLSRINLETQEFKIVVLLLDFNIEIKEENIHNTYLNKKIAARTFS